MYLFKNLQNIDNENINVLKEEFKMNKTKLIKILKCLDTPPQEYCSKYAINNECNRSTIIDSVIEYIENANKEIDRLNNIIKDLSLSNINNRMEGYNRGIKYFAENLKEKRQ